MSEFCSQSHVINTVQNEKFHQTLGFKGQT